MIVLFTDYGLVGPYLGQVQTVIYNEAPDEKVINLMADAPRHNPRASAYLLDAVTGNFTDETIFFCVIDPGVGRFDDTPVVLKIDQQWFVGPDNGLFDMVVRRSESVKCWKIHWRPENMSASFHGRDLYAPICAMIANGIDIPGEKMIWNDNHNWPDQLNEIIYIDHFGNCMTGIKLTNLEHDRVITVNGQQIQHANTFAAAGKGIPFWYGNSNGLVEIAVNQGNAQQILDLSIGNLVEV